MSPNATKVHWDIGTEKSMVRKYSTSKISRIDLKNIDVRIPNQRIYGGVGGFFPKQVDTKPCCGSVVLVLLVISFAQNRIKVI